MLLMGANMVMNVWAS